MTRHVPLISVFVFLALSLSVDAVSANDVKIKDNHMQYGGINYFRVGADRVVLGAFGEKKSPVTKGNYLEVQSTLPASKLEGKIKSASIAEIDFSSSSKTDVEANLSGVKVVGGGGSVTYEKLKNKSLKLVHLIVLPGDMKNAFNGSKKALTDLASYGKDARIAHEIFVVMEAKMAESFTSSTSFNVTATNGEITVSGKGGNTSSGSTSITLSPGTTFGYLITKIDWNKDKTAIEKLTDDQWGTN